MRRRNRNRADAGPPICYNCQRRKPNDSNPFVCDAFPGGIPAAIIENRADHRTPFPGDRGLTFVPIDSSIPFPEFGEPAENVEV
jgi:hypothetical protein